VGRFIGRDYTDPIVDQYNFLAPNVYGSDGGVLRANAEAIGASLRTDPQTGEDGKFPYHPLRFTEYGIPIDEGPAGDYLARASMYTEFIQWARSGVFDYVLALHVFVAAPSSADHALWQLRDDEVASFTGSIGCVGP
jgi:hypothetical protein